MLRTTLALLLFAAVASAQDSPLVALAKRSNRAASKTVVITNETLATSKGRVSTSESETQVAQTTSAPAPATSPAPAAAPQAAAKPATRPASAASAVVPPPAEYSLPSTARNIEPQSTVRNVDPQSTVRNVDPQSTVKNIDPQSTARTIDPQTTARNVEPQTTNQPPQ